MSEIVQLASSTAPSGARFFGLHPPAVRTDAVHVVFTGIEETLAALRAGSVLGRAMSAPLRLIHFRAVPYPLSVHAPTGLSPVETDAFIGRVRAEGIDVRARVYLCRDERRVMPMAFKRHSFIVIGGRHRWWPTRSERLRRLLEDAGHFVVLVDAFGGELSHA
jgi:hypothetical protein